MRTDGSSGGLRLLEPMADWLTQAGAVRVIVDAPPENPYRAFYLKHGAVPLDEYWLHWLDVSQLLRRPGTVVEHEEPEHGQRASGS